MTAFWWIMIPVFAGYTASFMCVVLERGGVRNADGRSMCVCGEQIPAYRNIPVITWLVQRGRASCCGAPIPAWYWVAETGAVGASIIGLVVAGPIGGVVAIALAMGALWVWFKRRDK